jgi:hypothetical protein
MKDDVNDEVPNENPQTLKYLSNWVLNWNGVSNVHMHMGLNNI